jgi:hypothetical protein
VIASPTRDNLNVAADHSLTGDIPAVDSYVEAHRRTGSL